MLNVIFFFVTKLALVLISVLLGCSGNDEMVNISLDNHVPELWCQVFKFRVSICFLSSIPVTLLGFVWQNVV
jgi:hypothetical protein